MLFSPFPGPSNFNNNHTQSSYFMKNLNSLLFLAGLLCLPFIGCKNEKEPVDTNDPVLTITRPAENEAFTGEVHIELNATDESLHEMSIKVTKDSDGSVVYEDAPEVHDLTDFDYHEHFTPTGLTGVTAMTLTVEVEDHSSHKVTKTVKFTVQ